MSWVGEKKNNNNVTLLCKLIYLYTYTENAFVHFSFFYRLNEITAPVSLFSKTRKIKEVTFLLIRIVNYLTF